MSRTRFFLQTEKNGEQARRGRGAGAAGIREAGFSLGGQTVLRIFEVRGHRADNEDGSVRSRTQGWDTLMSDMAL